MEKNQRIKFQLGNFKLQRKNNYGKIGKIKYVNRNLIFGYFNRWRTIDKSVTWKSNSSFWSRNMMFFSSRYFFLFPLMLVLFGFCVLPTFMLCLFQMVIVFFWRLHIFVIPSPLHLPSIYTPTLTIG